jgi:hypothetical protein
MKKKWLALEKKYIGYWPVQTNGNKFATGQILEKPVEAVKGGILAGWAPKSPEPWLLLSAHLYLTSQQIIGLISTYMTSL